MLLYNYNMQSRKRVMIAMGFWQKNKLMIGFLVSILVLGFGGYRYYQTTKIPEQAVKTAVIERGNIKSTISATGALSAFDNVDINSKITGRIVAVYVEENQYVKAGQPLLKLDDTSLLATQTQMQAKLRNAELNYNRYMSLQAQGAVARSEYDTAEADYIVAKANYEQAVSNTGDTLIVSPINGYVIGKPTPVGQTVSSGISTPQVLMSVANLDKMQIDVLVDESDIGSVKVGQQVEFTVDSYTDLTFKGVVRLVSKSAVTNNNVIYYTVYVDVDNAEGKLLPTMTARTEIVTGQAENVLMVPITCLRTTKDRKYVQVYEESTKTTRDVDVEVGMTGDDKVEVRGQLTEGEKVLVKAAKPTSSKNNGMGGPPPMH